MVEKFEKFMIWASNAPIDKFQPFLSHFNPYRLNYHLVSGILEKNCETAKPTGLQVASSNRQNLRKYHKFC